MAFILISASLHIFISRRDAAGASTVPDSLLFGGRLLVLAGATAVLLWLFVRFWKGREHVPDFHDFVLWNTCVLGALAMMHSITSGS